MWHAQWCLILNSLIYCVDFEDCKELCAEGTKLNVTYVLATICIKGVFCKTVDSLL